MGVVKDEISCPFNYVEQNDYVKIMIGCVWGNSGREVRCLPMTLDYQKGHWFFQFTIELAVFEVSTTVNNHLKISIRRISGKFYISGVSTV